MHIFTYFNQYTYWYIVRLEFLNNYLEKIMYKIVCIQWKSVIIIVLFVVSILLFYELTDRLYRIKDKILSQNSLLDTGRTSAPFQNFNFFIFEMFDFLLSLIQKLITYTYYLCSVKRLEHVRRIIGSSWVVLTEIKQLRKQYYYYYYDYL